MSTQAQKRSTLEKLNPKFLACHEYGHAWDFLRDEELVSNTHKVVVQCTKVDHCLRCSMLRRGVFMVPSWDPVGNYSYDAPEGYYLNLPDDGHRTTRAEVRAESGKRRNRRFKQAAAAAAKSA